MINKPPRGMSLRQAAWQRTTAHHEGGHAVAAIDLGIEFIEVDIISTQNRGGQIQYVMSFGSSAHSAWRRLQEGQCQNSEVSI